MHVYLKIMGDPGAEPPGGGLGAEPPAMVGGLGQNPQQEKKSTHEKI